MAGSHHPNVIVILADDLGYGDLSIYGNDGLQTPYLDRLAREGVRLSQHYTSSPLCAPARAGLLTGRYNHRTGALSVESNRGLDRIALREMTIADLFKAGGYATGMVGKWHNGLFDKRHHPNSRGFDEFVGFLNGGMWYYDWILDVNGQPWQSNGRYLTDVFTDQAIGFIRRYRHQPFFLYLAYNAPHVPLEAPEEDIAHFREMGLYNEAVCILYAMIRRMDAGIGRILETLKELGLDENTLVLFTSDNGPWLGNHRYHDQVYSMSRYNGPFRGMKQDVLEGGIRLPAIARWPEGLPRGEEFHAMVHFCDWLPTLLAAAGITARPDLPLDGTNVLPALRGETGQLNTKRFWQFNRYEPVLNCNAAMRDGDWKLYWPWIPEAKVKLAVDNDWYRHLYDVPHFEVEIDMSPIEREVSAPGEPQLYNLDEDPYEKQNLAALHPDRTRKMITELETWFDTVNAERRSLPETWPVE
jgi:arylsulfatase A